VKISGRGQWNGDDGYGFEAIASDGGEPGRHRDALFARSRNARGLIVANVSGPLEDGNVQSVRVGRCSGRKSNWQDCRKVEVSIT
jgi:hypothetical protein